MAHSFIIQLTPQRPQKSKLIQWPDISDDPVLTAHCDWYGSDAPYKTVITDIKERLRPTAFINIKKKTLTFKSAKTITGIVLKNLYRTYRKVHKAFIKDGTGIRTYHGVIESIEQADVAEYLFYYQEPDSDLIRCHTLSELIFDHLNGWLPKNLHIGGILYYHF